MLKFNLEGIPSELRSRPQWVFCGDDKQPHYTKDNIAVHRASSTDPRTWMPFSQCAEYAARNGLSIGYVLSKDDPYVCIDLDVTNKESQIEKGEPVDDTKWTTPEELNVYTRIVQAFNSYTETSKSTRGVHIWVKADLAVGRRRKGVEVYPHSRFIITTGYACFKSNIEEAQELVDQLIAEMPAGDDKQTTLVEVEQQYSDDKIWELAREADNGQKFIDLCEGRWSQYNYPSQSEADLALMSIFAFYSKSNEQCRRMFRTTELGKRKKATNGNRHLDYCLKVIRTRQTREEESLAQGDQMCLALMNNLRAIEDIEKSEEDVPVEHKLAMMLPVPSTESWEIPWPPGFMGAIANFIYMAAPRPVKEMAIVAALGIMAGICGKSYYIPKSGLNLYMILVAQSGQGKEGIATGISALINSLATRVPAAANFFDFGLYASGPALLKEVATNNSFLNVCGEFGRVLARMANEDRMDGPMQQLRTVMTDIYQKSGPASIVGGIKYSSKDKNVANVQGVNYSLLGETNPTSFYKSLTETMMADGFLSRFLIIEYNGQRPPLNEHAVDVPDQALSDAMARLCNHSISILGRGSARQRVAYCPEAHKIIQDFNNECDREVNGTDDETYRQMWNRAALKMMRVAALLAVADNYITPVVTVEHCQWALGLIRRDIEIMNRHIQSGDIGGSDQAREKKILALCVEYYQNKNLSAAYNVKHDLREAGIIPRRYLQIRCSPLAAFSGHKLGSTIALNSAIKNLVENGHLMEVKEGEVIEKYKQRGKFYKLIDMAH